VVAILRLCTVFISPTPPSTLGQTANTRTPSKAFALDIFKHLNCSVTFVHRQMVNQHIMILRIAKRQLITPQTHNTINNHPIKSEHAQQSTSNGKITAINANAACNLSTAGKHQSADPRSASRRLAPTSAIKHNHFSQQFINGTKVISQTVAQNIASKKWIVANYANQPNNTALGNTQCFPPHVDKPLQILAYVHGPQRPNITNVTGHLAEISLSANSQTIVGLPSNNLQPNMWRSIPDDPAGATCPWDSRPTNTSANVSTSQQNQQSAGINHSLTS